jgi:hypothetical protein
MLAEVFILRLEAISRNAEAQSATSSDLRFVPIKLPVKSAKTSAAGR